jgi:hypothetical protein
MSEKKFGEISLKGLLEAHGDHLTDARSVTRSRSRMGGIRLASCFGAEREADSITDADALLYRDWLEAQRGPRLSTVECLCRQARRIFRFGVRKELVRRNPFATKPHAPGREVGK